MALYGMIRVGAAGSPDLFHAALKSDDANDQWMAVAAVSLEGSQAALSRAVLNQIVEDETRDINVRATAAQRLLQSGPTEEEKVHLDRLVREISERHLKQDLSRLHEHDAFAWETLQRLALRHLNEGLGRKESDRGNH